MLTHHQLVPGVAGDEAAMQVNVRPSFSNSIDFTRPPGDPAI
jgi:hypothetical protein